MASEQIAQIYEAFSQMELFQLAVNAALDCLGYDEEITLRQLVSNIKVVSEDTLMVCFKNGTEIAQMI